LIKVAKNQQRPQITFGEIAGLFLTGFKEKITQSEFYLLNLRNRL